MANIIQCITNDVTKNDCANVILAVGASPIMAGHIKEVEEVQTFSSALLLNLGATRDYDAMKKAAKVANDLGHPIVVDPVGVSGISFRRDFCLELLREFDIACIRGNKSEMAAILKNQNMSGGLDDPGIDTEDEQALIKEMERVSLERGTILVASGSSDIITDGRQTIILGEEYGHELMRRVTGSGCMSSAVIASYIAEEGNAFSRVAEAMKKIGVCGKKAGDETLKEGKGTMTFKTKFIDYLSPL